MTTRPLTNLLPGMFVHFTGRPRGNNDPLPAGVATSAEDRLVQILISGIIQAHRGFADETVVCISEVTPAAAATMVTQAVNPRGAYAPFGVLLRRQAAIEAGFRPVLHVTPEEKKFLQVANGVSRQLRGRLVSYEPGRIDWILEREWRYISEDGGSLNLTGVVAGILAPSGWEPPRGRSYAEACRHLDRFSPTTLTDQSSDKCVLEQKLDLLKFRAPLDA